MGKRTTKPAGLQKPIPVQGHSRVAKNKKLTCNTSKTWQLVQARFPDHASSQFDEIYALPRPLIERLARELRLFSTSEQEFELALSLEAGAGFAFQAPMPLNAVTRALAPDFVPRDEISKRSALKSAEIQKLSNDDLRNNGLTEDSIPKHRQAEQDLENRLNELQVAYAGWLATNADFRKDIQVLREKWQQEIRKLGAFPHVNVSFFGESPWQLAAASPELNSDFMYFYREWCLESLATWDIPVPLRAHLADKTYYAFQMPGIECKNKDVLNPRTPNARLEKLDSFGFVGFVPWYLFREKSVDFYKLGTHQLTANSLRHLDSWIEKKPKNWGLQRSTMLLKMLVYLELALRRRYGPRLKLQGQRLDEVFARYFYGENQVDTDNVKKVRLELQQRLAGRKRRSRTNR